jgi:hypothetical protein
MKFRWYWALIGYLCFVPFLSGTADISGGIIHGGLIVNGNIVIDCREMLSINAGGNFPNATVFLEASQGASALILFRSLATYVLYATEGQPIFRAEGNGVKTIIFEGSPNTSYGQSQKTFLTGDANTTLILRGEPGENYLIVGDIFPSDGSGPRLYVEGGEWVWRGNGTFSDIVIAESGGGFHQLETDKETGEGDPGTFDGSDGAIFAFLPLCDAVEEFWQISPEGIGMTCLSGKYCLPGHRKGNFAEQLVHFTHHYNLPIFLRIGIGMAWERTVLPDSQKRHAFHHRIAFLGIHWRGRLFFAEAIALGDRVHHGVDRESTMGRTLLGEVLGGFAGGRRTGEEMPFHCAIALCQRRDAFPINRAQDTRCRLFCRQTLGGRTVRCFGEGSWEKSLHHSGPTSFPYGLFKTAIGMDVNWQSRQLSIGCGCHGSHHLRVPWLRIDYWRSQ